MQSHIQISHDPFGRFSIVRRKIWQGSCSWCGHLVAKWQYGTHHDDKPLNQINWHDGQFCSKSCHDSYHEGWWFSK